MPESQIIERLPETTVIRTGTNGQRLSVPNTLAILPIRNIVVFPGTVTPLNVGRQKSKALLDEVMPGEKVKITISYVDWLKYEDGTYEFDFPMVVGPRYIPGDPIGMPGTASPATKAPCFNMR